MGRSPTSSTMAWRPRSTNSLYESMCCLTRPLSWMNSLVRFQSWVVVTAKFSLSRNRFSKIFYYIPVKIRLASGGALADDLYDVSRLRANCAHGWIRRFDVGYLE